MALSTYFHNDPIFSLADLPSIVDELFGTVNPRSGRRDPNDRTQMLGLWRPRMDLHEDAESNLVTATFELPGLTKENVQIDADVVNRRLTISGEHKASEQKEDTEKGFTVRERRYGKFSRTLPLPNGIKPEEVKASLKDGLLTVTFPKTTPEQVPQRIAVE